MVSLVSLPSLSVSGFFGGDRLRACTHREQTWPLTVVVTSELWGTKHHGANYLLFDGSTAGSAYRAISLNQPLSQGRSSFTLSTVHLFPDILLPNRCAALRALTTWVSLRGVGLCSVCPLDFNRSRDAVSRKVGGADVLHRAHSRHVRGTQRNRGAALPRGGVRRLRWHQCRSAGLLRGR